MKKNIPVIIKQPNSCLGPVNTIQYVTRGYAFNYLIPNKLAEIVNKGKIKHIKMLNEIAAEQVNTKHKRNLKIKTILDKMTKINIRKRLGANRQIFGRINENEIIEQIVKLTGEIIDKKQVQVINIKEIGIYAIDIKIEETLRSTIKLQILPRIFP